MYKLHTHCRACGFAKNDAPPFIKATHDEKLDVVFDLGVQPLANDFKSPTEVHCGFAPLQVLFCPRCSLAQLSVVVDPAVLYSHYFYITSTSDTMKVHFGALLKLFAEEKPKVNSIMEIGSNDGGFLKFCKDNGTERVVGIDPAENLADLAETRGITTVRGLFDKKTAHTAGMVIPQPDFIVARHVFCHVDDWVSFIEALELVMDKDTIACIEVPYCGDMLAGVEFDTIYHEHLSYLTLRSMEYLLKDTKLHIHRISSFPIHGGVIVIMLRNNASDVEPDSSVETFTEYEDITEQSWKVFEHKAKEKINHLREFVLDGVANGHRFCGFGAPAKSTVWMNACGFSRREISFLCDSTPQKQYKLSPGSNIGIVDEGALLRDLPDYAIMWAWNYKKEILAKNKLYTDNGGKFIVPVPEFEVLP